MTNLYVSMLDRMGVKPPDSAIAPASSRHWKLNRGHLPDMWRPAASLAFLYRAENIREPRIVRFARRRESPARL